MKRSMLVRDYMSKNVVKLVPEMEILYASHVLISNDISGAPVVDEHGKLVGILTERDCMQVAMQADYHGVPGGLVRDHMSVNPQSVDPEESILKLAQLFLNNRFHRYPVLDNGHLIGVISRRDVMRAMGEFYPL
jgi:CBS domain-containing protein